jgi:hypothetical protein
VKTPFLGGTYVSRSTNLAASRAVNIYPEIVETKEGKEIGGFYGCPGLTTPLVTLGSGPIRASLTCADGKLYVVSGNEVYKVDTSYTGTLLGTIGTSVGPVSMTATNFQLLISDGSSANLVTLASGALSAVPSFPASGAILAEQDGFALTNIVGTNQFNQSNSNDLGTWHGLDFTTADGQSGNVIAVADLSRELWVLCDNNTEIWVNAGLAGFAFQRLQGVYVEVGCAAPSSVCSNAAQSLMWIGKNENGGGICYRSKGYSAQRVTTHSVERIWKTYPTIADAVAFSYQQEGHTFYIASFPSGDATWAYDVGTGYWHERAAFYNGAFHRHAVATHSFFNGVNVVGDTSNGNLYAFDLGTYTDNGVDRKWMRTWRAIDKAIDEPLRFESLEIQAQTGIGVPADANPIVMLRWSDDGGHNWSNEKAQSFGLTGETSKRVMFRRLGSTRKNSGLDRIFELSGAGNWPVALTGADMEASKQ